MKFSVMDLGVSRMFMVALTKSEYDIVSRAIQFDSQITAERVSCGAYHKQSLEKAVRLIMAFEKAYADVSTGIVFVTLPEELMMIFMDVMMSATGTLFDSNGAMTPMFAQDMHPFRDLVSGDESDINECVGDIMSQFQDNAPVSNGAFVLKPEDLAGFNPHDAASMDALRQKVANMMHVPVDQVSVSAIPVEMFGKGGVAADGEDVQPVVLSDNQKAEQERLSKLSVQNPLFVLKAAEGEATVDEAKRAECEALSVLWGDKPVCDGATLLGNVTSAFARGEVTEEQMRSVLDMLRVSSSDEAAE